MTYEVYCDESCIEAIFDKDAHKYAAIGGVWIPAYYRQKLKQELNIIKEKHNVKGELKWNKVSPKYLELYKEVVSLFFTSDTIKFRVILLEASKINNEAFNQSSGELGFYKFYFQLVRHWLYDNNTYSIFLDHKINAYKSRVHELGRILKCSSNADIDNVQALPSEDSVVIQLADILTGAVAARFNDNTTSVAKSEVIKLIEIYLGHHISPTKKSEDKFNVFNMNLEKSW